MDGERIARRRDLGSSDFSDWQWTILDVAITVHPVRADLQQRVNIRIEQVQGADQVIAIHRTDGAAITFSDAVHQQRMAGGYGVPAHQPQCALGIVAVMHRFAIGAEQRTAIQLTAVHQVGGAHEGAPGDLVAQGQFFLDAGKPCQRQQVPGSGGDIVEDAFDLGGRLFGAGLAAALQFALGLPVHDQQPAKNRQGTHQPRQQQTQRATRAAMVYR
ncbi:hypothetical protein D3C72_1395610 [compost metagenome]